MARLLVSSKPKTITPAIETFCRMVASSGEIIEVPVRPTPQAEEQACFRNVDMYCTTNGGSMVCGWIIWEVPFVFLEAEFHAIWASTDKKYIDVTPKDHNLSSILFLVDSQRFYENKPVANIQYPLLDSPILRDYFDVLAAIAKLREEHHIDGKPHPPNHLLRPLVRQREQLQARLQREVDADPSFPDNTPKARAEARRKNREKR